MLQKTKLILIALLSWIAIAIFILTLGVKCSSSLLATTVTDVIIAIEKVESNQNPYAINKKENALGCLQIRPIMIADYNRITGEDLPHDIAYNKAMAYIIAQEIFFHYMKGIEKPNAKHLAFIWNGGGSAWRRVDAPRDDLKQKKLEIYWAKVQKHL
jgi:soluble lytic murein transglycosylase-like protein